MALVQMALNVMIKFALHNQFDTLSLLNIIGSPQRLSQTLTIHICLTCLAPMHVYFNKGKKASTMISTFTVVLFALFHTTVLAHGGNSCKPGYYLPPSGNECSLCPAGTFQPRSGAVGCIPCPTGYITSTEGSTFCTPCKRSETSNRYHTTCICTTGYEFDYGLNKCKICPAGSAYTKSGSYSYCTTCEPGTYQPNKGALKCLACSKGSQSVSGATKCISCSKDEALISGSCGTCRAGYYYEKYSATCEKCYPGTFQPTKGIASECQACPEGSYSGYGYSSCTFCKKYQALMKNGKCSSCKAGEYYNSYSLKCEVCGPDTSTPGRRVYQSCFNCGFSSFSFEGGKKCVKCKEGLTLLSTGKCGKCPAGTYLDIYDGRKCIPCQVNRYSREGMMDYCSSCPTGTYALPGSKSCVSCPEGQAIISKRGRCGTCPPGKYYENYSATCTKCLDGEYKPDPGIDFCLTCPEGSISSKDRTACVVSNN